jgi:ribosomal protein S18 acetylase RimI-like enzyme
MVAEYTDDGRGTHLEITALEKAEQSDRGELLEIIRCATEHLNQIGVLQWDEVYPNAANVDEDLRNGQLYVVRAAGRIAGMVTLNQACDLDYANGQWQAEGPDFMVIHRLIVPPSAQGQGVGTRMMLNIETMLREQGTKSIRLDAFTQNPHSLRLYEKLGYRIVGEAQWRKGRFFLMEKDIRDVTGRQDA